MIKLEFDFAVNDNEDGDNENDDDDDEGESDDDDVLLKDENEIIRIVPNRPNKLSKVKFCEAIICK